MVEGSNPSGLTNFEKENIMKIKKVIQVTTDSLKEEQFLLIKFPEATWYPTGPTSGVTFFFDENKEEKVQKIVHEWQTLNE